MSDNRCRIYVIYRLMSGIIWHRLSTILHNVRHRLSLIFYYPQSIILKKLHISHIILTKLAYLTHNSQKNGISHIILKKKQKISRPLKKSGNYVKSPPRKILNNFFLQRIIYFGYNSENHPKQKINKHPPKSFPQASLVLLFSGIFLVLEGEGDYSVKLFPPFWL